ncbi:MAG: ester cyclase [Halobacteriales archaeon]
MSAQEGHNETRLREYTERVWNDGDVEAIEEFVADDYAMHDPAFFQFPPGPAGLAQAVRIWHHAFPDAAFRIEDVVADGDRVAARWTATGTHEGELMGIEPTGAEVAFSGFELDLMAEGVLRETWTVYDALGVLRQIGAVPELPLE